MEHNVISSIDFLSRDIVKEVQSRALTFKKSNTEVSDIIDGEGNQYVDLVQEGGGVLGIALVGYTWAMEKAGIRFFSLAGTSAGAINTLLLASDKNGISSPKSEALLKEISNLNLFSLVDGDKQTKKIIQLLVDGKTGLAKFLICFHIFRIIRRIRTKHGLNPGSKFQQWIAEILLKNKITTTAELNSLREELPPGLKHRRGEDIRDLKPRLVMVSSEITTQTKVFFPEMNSLYWKTPAIVNPSEYVRASMSIPFFFEPFKVNNLPNGALAQARWKSLVKFDGTPPTEAVFVDGGMVSNFPIDVFHNLSRIPRMPSFGVRLSSYRENISNTSKLTGFIGAMVNTMRHISDYDFLLQNPDYSQLICKLDTDKKFNWLDFNMTDENKMKLFEIGAKGAMDFLETFNWNNYKEIRKQLMNNNNALQNIK